MTGDLVSVVTIAFNEEDTIRDTLESVTSQTYDQLQYVVIDGNSTDGTMAVVKEFEASIDVVLCEPDRGIYDAMNKSLNYLRGEWCIFMNAGDCFQNSHVLSTIFGGKDLRDAEVVYGDVELRYDHFTSIKKAGDLNNLWKGMQFSHQSVFVKTTLLKAFPFSLDQGSAADFGQLYRLYVENKRFYQVPELIGSVAMGGISDKQRSASIKRRSEVVIPLNDTLKVRVYYQFCLLQNALFGAIKRMLGKSTTARIIQMKNKILG